MESHESNRLPCANELQLNWELVCSLLPYYMGLTFLVEKKNCCVVANPSFIRERGLKFELKIK